jgi:hypothetical protein
MNVQNDALPQSAPGVKAHALLTAMPPRTSCPGGTMIINTGSLRHY